MEKELNPKQQTSEAIRAAESILIITGQNPTIDQVTSVVALNEILRKLGKKSNALISDIIPFGARFIADGKVSRQLDGLRDFIMQLNLANSEVDKLKYTIENGKLNVHITPFRGGFSQHDVTFDYGDYQYDLVVVIGVATASRIEKLYLQNVEKFQDVPVINIDFHRVNENYGAVNLVDTYAASLSEMLVALAESLQTGIIDEPIATILLTGIMASTDRFTANHTTPKALTVAAQMMALGANQQQVVKGLYQSRPRQEEPRRDQPRNDRSRNDSRSEQKPRVESSSQQSSAQRLATPQTPEPDHESIPSANSPQSYGNSQPHKQMVAGGVLQRPQASAPMTPSVPAAPIAKTEIPSQDPQSETSHPDNVIEMPASAETARSQMGSNPPQIPQPESQIIAGVPRAPMPPNPLEGKESFNSEKTPNPKEGKGVNPANNPTFAGR